MKSKRQPNPAPGVRIKEDCIDSPLILYAVNGWRLRWYLYQPYYYISIRSLQQLLRKRWYKYQRAECNLERLSLTELDLLTTDVVNDMFTEKVNDEYDDLHEVAVQLDFDFKNLRILWRSLTLVNIYKKQYVHDNNTHIIKVCIRRPYIMFSTPL